MRLRLFRPSERLAGPLAVLVLATGCAVGVDAPESRPSSPHPESAYLADPLLGYPRGVAVDERLRLAKAHESLVERRDPATTESEARALLERNPDLHPAELLLAQVDHAAGSYAAALERAGRLELALETYFAARLLVARAAEKTDDPARAFGAYFELAERSSIAAERAAQLRPRALEIIANRTGDALRRGRTDEAGKYVSNLARWAPGEPVTLLAARDLAAAVGDRDAELVAVRRLEPLFPEDISLRAERADLELEIGDPSIGLRIYQDLADAEPGDPDLANKLARAKFLWRLTLLPESAKALVRQPQLSRGEFAAVLYWLFPQVRYGRSETGTIATDVLDHEYRQEIVRVVNLDLVTVDPDLHTYQPNRPQNRVEALFGFLRVLEGQEPRVACLGPEGSLAGPSQQQICRVAARCGLIPEVGECLPLADLSGPTAFEMSRGALGQLGIE